MPELNAELETAAADILQALQTRGAVTAWDLKMSLKISHTRLHLALGILLERRKVLLRPEKLTLRVEPVPSAIPAAPAATSA